MKTKAFITALLLLANILGVYSQQDFLSKLFDNPNVKTVTISKVGFASFSELFIGHAIERSVEGVETKHITKKLEQLDILSSDNKETSRQMKTTVENHIAKSKSYEMLMKIKDGTSNIIFYAEQHNKAFKSLIMVIEDNEKYKLIRIKGNFTAEDLRGLTHK